MFFKKLNMYLYVIKDQNSLFTNIRKNIFHSPKEIAIQVWNDMSVSKCNRPDFLQTITNLLVALLLNFFILML